MQLNDARQLKTDLLSAVVSPLAATQEVRALGVGAASPADAVVPPTLALGIARRDSGDFQLAVRVQQRGLENHPAIDHIRQQTHGEVNVHYIGQVTTQTTLWHQKRNRPLRLGGSVGHFKSPTGTLGCFVRDRKDGALLLLSNNHVLAHKNRAGKKDGDAILQPGVLDGGCDPDDVVARLRRVIRLKKLEVNLIDAAVAALGDGVKCSRHKLGKLGNLAGLGDVFLDAGEAVAKVGRTTGETMGRVTAFELDNVIVYYRGLGYLRFDKQIEIEGAGDRPFSQGGDSGSLIVDAERRGVALLFAGGDIGGQNGKGLTYANPLRVVLDTLAVDLVF